METWIRSSLHILLLFPSGAPLNLEVLDGVASCIMFCLIQVVNGWFVVGQVGLGVDGSMIDVLVSDRASS